LVLNHTPPVAEGVILSDADTHTVLLPLSVPATGSGFTVMVIVAAAVPQLLETAYDITDVPAARPLTVPPDTVAAALSVLLQMPPVTEGVRVTAASSQTVSEPLSVPATGRGFTVTVTESAAVPQLLVTV
jgi:hypothetical protein